MKTLDPVPTGSGVFFYGEENIRPVQGTGPTFKIILLGCHPPAYR
jgi:hypothetical protein